MPFNIDSSELPIDPRTNDPYMDVDLLPWSDQDFAHNQVAVTFGLTEEMIDLFPLEVKTYWSSLIEAVSSCNLLDPNNAVNVMHSTEIIGLHQTALDSGNDVRYLQEFGHHAKKIRRQVLKGRMSLPEPDANQLYRRATDSFSFSD